ncbi:hypothetical protein FXO38_03741 [Capsicum annuum]|nr:hypothetical protein FXO38_03741 [Capsicum annuum]
MTSTKVRMEKLSLFNPRRTIAHLANVHWPPRKDLTRTMTKGKQVSSGSSGVKNPVAAEHVHTNGTVTPGVVAKVLQNEGVGVKLTDPKMGVGGSKLTEADPKLNMTNLKLKAVAPKKQLTKKGITQQLLEGDASSSILVDQRVITKKNIDIPGKILERRKIAHTNEIGQDYSLRIELHQVVWL